MNSTRADSADAELLAQPRRPAANWSKPYQTKSHRRFNYPPHNRNEGLRLSLRRAAWKKLCSPLALRLRVPAPERRLTRGFSGAAVPAATFELTGTQLRFGRRGSSGSALKSQQGKGVTDMPISS